MVELEEVEDADLDRPQAGPINEDDEDSADFTDTGNYLQPSPVHIFLLLLLLLLLPPRPAPRTSLTLTPPCRLLHIDLLSPPRKHPQ